MRKGFAKECSEQSDPVSWQWYGQGLDECGEKRQVALGRDIGDGTQSIVNPAEKSAALYLLFEVDQRPTAAALRSALADVADVEIVHEGQQDVSPAWVELVHQGLTFDCTGLAPASAIDSPEIRYRMDLPEDVSSMSHEAIALVPGPHLTGGAASLPVVRGWASLARHLIQAFPAAVAAVWGPSASTVSPDAFTRLVDSWIGGGPFPPLAFISMKPSGDAGVASDGLAFFIGQELVIDDSAAADRVAATQLAVRIIADLIASGSVEEPMRFVGMDGTQLELAPSDSRDQLIVRAV